MKSYKISAVICAAGKGERAGFGRNKLLAPLDGAPALWHTLEKFNIKEIDEVIVTSSETDFKEISALCAPFGYKVVSGGKTRTESVKNALKEVTGDIVLIHDGARPYVSREIILNCIESVKKFGSAICAIKLVDTAVCAEYGQITDRLNRDSTYRVQTPQGFFTEDIKYAYSLAGDRDYTDDSAVYGEFISPPRLIAGSEENIKLTFKNDFIRGIYGGQPLSGRVGFGVDVHAFGDGNGVLLGGVNIPCDRGLIAHSDGDVIVHALMDALLSAGGLKDIGVYFPDNDDTYAGADSCALLENTVKMLLNAGYVPVNISIAVQAEKPRLSPHVDKMREKLAAILGIRENDIAISAGTCEKLGFVGQGLGICAYAFVSLKEV